jgi:hypothetical protein
MDSRFCLLPDMRQNTHVNAMEVPYGVSSFSGRGWRSPEGPRSGITEDAPGNQTFQTDL